MKRKKLVQLFVSDGSALYLNGNQISDNFTRGQASILEALGHNWTGVRGSELHYRTEKFPAKLKDAVLQNPPPT